MTLACNKNCNKNDINAQNKHQHTALSLVTTIATATQISLHAVAIKK
jgi:hypothetical protein